MRVVFFGTPDVAETTLARLIESGVTIPLVVTQPDRAVGRSKKLVPPPVKRLALEHGLPVEQPEKVRTRSFRERIGALEPDVLAVVAYGRILSQRLLDQTPWGAVNVHFSLLPKYRGAAPVQWALANGEAQTGVTTMRMNARLDEGDILMQRARTIEAGEHAPQLAQRLAADGAELLMQTLEQLRDGKAQPVEQQHDQASYAPILTRRDGWVDPAQQTAIEIEGRVRGFDPWPGVWMQCDGKRWRITRATALGSSDDGDAGTLVALDDGYAMRCREGMLRLDELQPEGRRRMPVEDAINGRQLTLDARFEARVEG